MGCHSKWNVTKNGMSLKMECHSKWNVTQNRMSLKMEYHSKWNVMKNGLSLKMKSYIRHEDFRSSFVCLSVRQVRTTPLDSETGWTGELWLKTNLLNWQN